MEEYEKEQIRHNLIETIKTFNKIQVNDSDVLFTFIKNFIKQHNKKIILPGLVASYNNEDCYGFFLLVNIFGYKRLFFTIKEYLNFGKDNNIKKILTRSYGLEYQLNKKFYLEIKNIVIKKHYGL